MSDDVTVVAIGDSAMWGTGTAYRYKPPNLVHKILNEGEPMPPVQLRARGGGIIGHPRTSLPDRKIRSWTAKDVDNSLDRRDTSWEDGWTPPGPGYTYGKDDDYGYTSEWDQLNRETRRRGDLDVKNINNLKWAVRRDVGKSHPTHLEQLEQFDGPTTTRADGTTVVDHELDVPWQGDSEVRFYKDEDYPPVDAGQSGTTDEWKPETNPPAPEEVDLVLLNGATNDVGLLFMMNYLDHTYLSLMQRIAEYCYRDNKVLLREARKQFPNALLVLVGYPFFLSEWSNYKKSKEFLRKLGGFKALAGIPPTSIIVERVIDGGMVFHRAHQHYMRKAVADRAHVEARRRDPGVMYVSRGFGAINAFEGPDPWAWSIGNDDLFERRKHLVEDILGEDGALDKYASIGHPNRKGSIETARAIVDRYRERYDLPVGETAIKIDRVRSKRPWRLRQALSSYDLVPNSFGGSENGSVRNALSYRYVDSIQLKFYRGTELKHAGGLRTPHLPEGADVYLDLDPGRNGSGETFRVDYESDGEKFDTPQFDRHSRTAPLGGLQKDWHTAHGRNWAARTMDRDGDRGDDTVVTEVNFDPMAGRKTDAKVGTNYGKSRGQKEDNVDDQSKQRDIFWDETDHGTENHIPNDREDFRDRWDDDRMMLWHVKEATLRVTNPKFWALRKVELTINGDLTWTVTNTRHGGLEKTLQKATRNDWNDVSIDLLP